MKNSAERCVLIFGVVLIIIVWMVLNSSGETNIKMIIPKGELEIKRKQIFISDSAALSFPILFIGKHNETIKTTSKRTETDL